MQSMCSGYAALSQRIDHGVVGGRIHKREVRIAVGSIQVRIVVISRSGTISLSLVKQSVSRSRMCACAGHDSGEWEMTTMCSMMPLL